jgi:hypothetical protein
LKRVFCIVYFNHSELDCRISKQLFAYSVHVVVAEVPSNRLFGLDLKAQISREQESEPSFQEINKIEKESSQMTIPDDNPNDNPDYDPDGNPNDNTDDSLGTTYSR